MNLNAIAIANIKRRKAKAAFVLTGLLIAVATVVALLGLRQAVSSNMLLQLEQYGANIVILPKSDNLALSYGGISLGGVSFDVRNIFDTHFSYQREMVALDAFYPARQFMFGLALYF